MTFHIRLGEVLPSVKGGVGDSPDDPLFNGSLNSQQMESHPKTEKKDLCLFSGWDEVLG